MLYRAIKLSLCMSMAYAGLSAFNGDTLINMIYEDGSITERGCVSVSRGKETTIESFSENGKLIVHIEIGDIKITPSDTNELKVIIEKQGLNDEAVDNLKVDFTHSFEKASIYTESRKRDAWVNLEIQVPKNTKLSKIVTHHGDIAISNMDNKIWAKSFYYGCVELNNINGPVKKAKVEQGRVCISMREGSHHSIKAKALRGSINITQAGGKVRACVKNGDISLCMANAHIEKIEAKNSNIYVRTKKGKIDLHLTQQDQGTFSFKTSKDNSVHLKGEPSVLLSNSTFEQKGKFGCDKGSIVARAHEGNIQCSVSK